MKYQSSLKWMIPLIFVLALFAAGAGLFWPAGDGQPYPLTTFRGEEVTINARGLYYWDTVSSKAQMQANDLITLVVGLPLLAFSTWLAFRGSFRGQLLLAGTLGFFLYTYMSMAFNTAFNDLFIVYVALFSLSLYAFILSMMSFDLSTLPQRFSDALPRGWIAGLMIVTAVFLLFAWLGGRILPTITQDAVPAMENTTTMVIQAMDLGLILPFAILAAVQLLRRSAWGYLLSSVAVMKFITMGLAVSGMGINMALNGEPDSAVLVGIFLVITLANLVIAYFLLKSIQQPAPKKISALKAARAGVKH